MTAITWSSHQMRLALVAVSALILVGCRGEAPVSPQARVLKNVIVAVDFSGSRSEAALQESKELLGKIVDSLKPDDRITVLHVEGQGMQHGNGLSATIPHVQSLENPTAAEEREIRAAVEDIRLAASKLFDAASSLELNGTDIVSTLFEVSDHLADAGNRQSTLVLMSDMIQAGNGISFVRATGVPSRDWIKKRTEANMVPKLDGLCVTVVGADASTAQGVKIREFWTAYFNAASGKFSIDRYRHSVTRFESLFCGPVDSKGPAAVRQSASAE